MSPVSAVPEAPAASLCFRCEHRARFLETGAQPRSECGEVTSSKTSCYMYRPVDPVVLAKEPGDVRPQFAGALFSARSSAVRVARTDLRIRDYPDGRCLFVTPKNARPVTNPKGGTDKRWRGKE